MLKCRRLSFRRKSTGISCPQAKTARWQTHVTYSIGEYQAMRLLLRGICYISSFFCVSRNLYQPHDQPLVLSRHYHLPSAFKTGPVACELDAVLSQVVFSTVRPCRDGFHIFRLSIHGLDTRQVVKLRRLGVVDDRSGMAPLLMETFFEYRAAQIAKRLWLMSSRRFLDPMEVCEMDVTQSEFWSDRAFALTLVTPYSPNCGVNTAKY